MFFFRQNLEEIPAPNLESLHLLCWPWLALLKPHEKHKPSHRNRFPPRPGWKNPRAPWVLVLAKAIPQSSQGEEPFKFYRLLTATQLIDTFFPPQEEVIIMSTLMLRKLFVVLTFWGLEARHGQKTQKTRTCDDDQTCQRWEKSNLFSRFWWRGHGFPWWFA